jgi:SAM-dependent methyltransferase
MKTIHEKRTLLTPSLFDQYYLEGITRIRKLNEVFSEKFDGKISSFSGTNPALLLDLGGRNSPYERLTQGLPIEWISADIKRYTRTDLVLDSQRLPFKNGVFNAVLCTQVLGCVPDILAAAREIHRILKPHGLAVLSEAAVFPPYGEAARWRILPGGWETLLAQFSECHIDADLNTAASFFRVLNLYLSILLQSVPLFERIWRYSFCPVINLLGRWANRHFKDSGFVANYFVVAKK